MGLCRRDSEVSSEPQALSVLQIPVPGVECTLEVLQKVGRHRIEKESIPTQDHVPLEQLHPQIHVTPHIDLPGAIALDPHMPLHIPLQMLKGVALDPPPDEGGVELGPLLLVREVQSLSILRQDEWLLIDLVVEGGKSADAHLRPLMEALHQLYAHGIGYGRAAEAVVRIVLHPLLLGDVLFLESIK